MLEDTRRRALGRPQPLRIVEDMLRHGRDVDSVGRAALALALLFAPARPAADPVHIDLRDLVVHGEGEEARLERVERRPRTPRQLQVAVPMRC